ncbi:MAG: Asp-tRNA(Asn)/Glu-tRNA(Gln) amidotransferase subunit GatB [Lachnospiraceae bacterium]|jgi:aspartyl-tRNA(Asn)/glutamyl-tRNA(Gln) amidotransferase subunit B|nr:Asp-tRNA(Asn)/Glu-tRNA(Gln) amidotransferase subunit GatB [Lachnospiraceae bacterium]
MNYETVIGLETHIELATKSKLFCACATTFGVDANENICPACMGMPGMTAVTNYHAVTLGIAAALVTNSEIAATMTFDKKSYFYPDLPGGYQITQMFAPICRNGWLDIKTATATRRITLKQIHIEEDAGKLVHDIVAGATLVDFNRASVPLAEIVTNPDFRSAEEVVAYLEKLRSLLSFAGISDCKMQEGSMRCDVNISVRKVGDVTFGTRTEIKNMNSLRAITRAIEYESERHIDALESGSNELIQETRRWDDGKGITVAMRDKEDAADYRYFPNPELLPITISDEWIDSVRASLPESAEAKYTRMTTQMGLSDYDSRIITGSRALSQIFDETLRDFSKPKDVVNWIMVELLSVAKGDNKGEDDISIDSKKFAKLISLVDQGVINRTIGKEILVKILADDIDPEKYIAAHGLASITDSSFITRLIDEVMSEYAASVAEYLGGNEKAYGFLVGQVMRKAERKADPKTVNEMLRAELKRRAN